MSNKPLRARNFAMAALLVAAIALVIRSARAQSAAPELSFEVVSIKPAGYHPGYDIDMRGDLYSAVGVTAEFLIKYAYGITDDQLSGGPTGSTLTNTQLTRKFRIQPLQTGTKNTMRKNKLKRCDQ